MYGYKMQRKEYNKEKILKKEKERIKGRLGQMWGSGVLVGG